MNHRQKDLKRLLTKSAALPTTANYPAGIRPGMSDQEKQDWLKNDRRTYQSAQPGVGDRTWSALKAGFGGDENGMTFADAPAKPYRRAWSENSSILGTVPKWIAGATADATSAVGRGILGGMRLAGVLGGYSANNFSGDTSTHSQNTFDNERQLIERRLQRQGYTGADLQKATDMVHAERMKELRRSGDWDDNRSTLGQGVSGIWDGLTNTQAGATDAERHAAGWSKVRQGVFDIFNDRRIKGTAQGLGAAAVGVASAAPMLPARFAVAPAAAGAGRLAQTANVMRTLANQAAGTSAGLRAYNMANDAQAAFTDRDLSYAGLIQGASPLVTNMFTDKPREATLGNRLNGDTLEVSPEAAAAYEQNQGNAYGPTGKPFDPTSLINLLAFLTPYLQQGQGGQAGYQDPRYMSAVDRAANNVRG